MSIINQYTSNSKTLNAILNKADSLDNKNGKIDTDKERDIVNKEAEIQKDQLSKEGVTVSCSTKDDIFNDGVYMNFKKGNDVFTAHFGYYGDIVEIGNYKEGDEQEDVAKFFGLKPNFLSQVNNFFGFGKVIYEDNCDNKLALHASNKLLNLNNFWHPDLSR